MLVLSVKNLYAVVSFCWICGFAMGSTRAQWGMSEIGSCDTLPSKSIKLRLWLRVENNNSFTQCSSKIIKRIEEYVLSRYNAEQLEEDGCEYDLTVPYNTDEELDEVVEELLADLGSIAGAINCSIETNISTLDGEKSW